MLDFDELVARLRAVQSLRLVAIDGLPLAGKTTLAERLAAVLDARCVSLDEFVRPEAEWASRDRPSFPFDFIRYDEFMKAVRSLATDGACSYRAFDFERMTIVDETTVVRLDRPIVVEGVSALHPDLAPLYDARIWVESDGTTTLAASVERGVGAWAREWRELFLPSVALYLETRPRERADFVARGRGK